MAEPTSSSTCPRCGSSLSRAAASGLCPRCLLAMNLRTRTMPTGENVPTEPPPSPAELEEKFPQFEILECLGRGGMGIVYRARQKALDRIVAIKILAGEWQDEAGFAQRFEKEAKLLAKLNHPNIVTIHDFGNAGGLYHIVMEYVDGVNVRDLLRDGKLESEQALAIVPPICDALQFAHDHGVVHRDIKPENILLDREGRVKIADFGIASIAGDAADRSGTPAYMAPEQSRHAAIDHRADIYALGVVLHEMLTGERPLADPVAPSRRVEIDVRLDEIVLRSLAAKPEQRFQQVSEVKGLVTKVMSTPRPEVPMAAVVPEKEKKAAVPWRVFLVPGILLLVASAVFGLWRAGYLNRDDVPDLVRFGSYLGGTLTFAACFTVLAWWRFRELGGVAAFPPPRKRLAMMAGLCVALGLLAMSVNFCVAVFYSRLPIAFLTPMFLWPAGLGFALFSLRSFEGKWAVSTLGFLFANVLVTTGVSGLRGLWYPAPFPNSWQLAEMNSVFQMVPSPGRGLAIDLESGTATTEVWAPVSFERRIAEQGADLYFDGSSWQGIDLDVAEGEGKEFKEVGSADVDIAAWIPRPGFAGIGASGGLWAFRTRDGIRGVIAFGSEENPAAIWWKLVDQGRLRSDADPGGVVRIGVAVDGTTSLGGRALAPDRLLEELRKLSAADPLRPVMIEAGRTVPYTSVLFALDLCGRASLTNLSFYTLPNPDEVSDEEPPLPGVEPDPGAAMILPGKEEDTTAPAVRVRIAGDGSVTLDDTPMLLDALGARLVEISRDEPGRRIEIISEEDVVEEDVLEVLKVFREADLTRIRFKKVEGGEKQGAAVPRSGAPGALSKPADPGPLQIRIFADSSLSLDGRAMSLDELQGELKKAAAADPDLKVNLSAEETARHQHVVEVMNACKEASIRNLSFDSARDRLQELDLTTALKSYEELQTRLREARLQQALADDAETLRQAERLVTVLEQSVREARAAIEKMESREEIAPKQ